MRAGLTQHQALIAILVFAIVFISMNALLFNLLDFTLIIIIDIAIFTLFNMFVLDPAIRRNNKQPFQKD